MIKAIQGTSLLDFPGRVATVIFTGGCNFRCPFCHNVSLVDPQIVRDTLDIDTKTILEELVKRQKFIDGVAITGGEPLLHPKIVPFVAEVKRLGLLVKIDTNGSFPLRLKEILPLVDYVAMDIKTSPRKYPLATGGRCNFRRVKESIKVLLSLNGRPDYEFRTTLVPGVVNEEDIKEITSLIKGAKRYALQIYRPGKTLQPGFSPVAYSREKMEKMRQLASKVIENVELRVD